MTEKKLGFTLIELLVVIAIMALILALALPNYLGARERARDTRVKSEMGQLKNALRVYYNDYQRYPSANSYKIQGCGVGGAEDCPCSDTFDFAVHSGGECDTVYMKKFPAERTFGNDIGNDIKYYASGDGEKYCIVTTLENFSDPDLVKSQNLCTLFCTGTGADVLTSSYVICSL